MSGWPLAALALSVTLLGLMIAIGRRSDRRTWPAWQTALTADDTQARDAFRCELDARFTSVDAALRLARSQHVAGEGGAISVLRRGVLSASRLARRLDDWLRRWRDAARALAALRPLCPQPAFAFRGWNLRALVLTYTALDAVLITSRQRFRGRLAFLRQAVRRLRRAFVGVARRARPGAQDFELLAERAELGRDDLKVVAAYCASALDALAVSRRSQSRT